MDKEFGLLEIGSNGVETENLVDVIDSAVLDSYDVLYHALLAKSAKINPIDNANGV